MASSIYMFFFIRLLFLLSLLHLILTHSPPFMKPLCHDDESSALLQFKESFVIYKFASPYYPLACQKVVSTWALEGDKSDCCSRDGVECDEDTGHVIGLDLSNSCLFGSINSSSSLFRLVHLKRLNLAYNYFNHSPIPPQVRNLSKLTYLNLTTSMFSGQIPSEISQLSHLTSLHLGSNYDLYSGKHLLELRKPDLPSLIGNLTRLQELCLDGVGIFSVIPTILANFSSLTSLYLYGCGLHGEFPVGIFKLPNLWVLDVGYNEGLIGYLPDFTWSSPLVALSLAATGFSGKLPPSIGNLSYLNVLDVSGCNFTGSIPSSLGNLTNLTILMLSNNTFKGDSGLHGEFPAGIFKLPNLWVLDVGYNEGLIGYLPDFTWSSPLVALSLAATGFSGKLPPSIGNLSYLNVLDVSGCNFTGSIPSSLGNLTNLTILMLSNNTFKGDSGLHGEFPAGIFKLPNLWVLDVGYNEGLIGYLPDFTWSSPLRILRLVATGFSGELPPSIGNLSYLNGLDVSGCNFSGSMPSSLGNLTNLIALRLSNNTFKGEVPSSIGKLNQLSILGLSNNQLAGPILFHLVNLVQLKGLYLESNHFTGEIPVEILNLTGLSALNLGGNKLQGRIPNSIGNLSYLNSLDVSSCNFTGSIPSSLGNLINLIDLSLSNNTFNGEVPSSFGNLNRLSSLGLCRNQLTGPIPNSIFNLTNLQYLDLSMNCFIGTLEFDEFVKLKHLTMLYLSYNQFSLLFKESNANASFPKLQNLALSSCNLSEFPDFLRNQDELEYLVLSENNLRGQVPKWMLNVGKASLELICLANNFLTGFAQSPILLPWTRLSILDLRSNLLQGSLPIPPVSTLQYYVSNNSLSGNVAKLFCNLSSLQVLDLASNNLSGSLPQCLDNFGDLLAILDLRRNKFEGSIPQTWLKGSQLKIIIFSQNKFQGQLPKSLVNCTMLKVLDLSNNLFNDRFPSWLENLPNLEVIILRSNKFKGPIKTSKSEYMFPNLQIIDLSYNRFVGNLPLELLRNLKVRKSETADHHLTYIHVYSSFAFFFKTFGRSYQMSYGYDYSMTMTNKGTNLFYEKVLESFIAVDMSSNRFSGEIPNSIENLRGCHLLNLSNNILTGHIPPSLGNHVELEALDLSHNKLTGEIPSELTQITSLGFFNVSHNNLTGPIPQGNQFDIFEQSSFEGNLGLCGKPLTRKCENSNEPPSQRSISQESQDSGSPFEFGWKIVVIGYGFGFVVGVIIGRIVIARKHDW